MKKSLFKILLTLIGCSLINSAYASELTIRSESSFIPTYKNRFSFITGLNPSFTKSTDMSNITLSYARSVDDYWIDTNFAMNKGLFNKFSTNNQSATGASNTQLKTQKNSLTSIGLGIGRETRYSQTLLSFKDIYEFMAANLTYNTYNEDFSGITFSGPGLLTKLSVYKRFSDYFSAGAHFNYNLAVVKRAKLNDTESNSKRSLSIGFLTVGIDLSIYL